MSASANSSAANSSINGSAASMDDSNHMSIIDPTGFTKITAQLPMLADILKEASQTLGLSLTAKQQRALLLYLDQLLLWNKAYNLTAITDPIEALIKHVLDCLAIIPHLPSGSLLDIGTGAGLPAVIIAICQPERHCTALDSNQKKIRFIRQISSQLGLDNVEPIAARIEAHEGRYEVVTSRAFASLTDFVAVAQPCLIDNGRLCAMKGKAPADDELQALDQKWQINTIKLDVPRLEESRHLIELSAKNV